MKCPKCNYESKDNTRFCVRCGTPLHKRNKKHHHKKTILAILIMLAIIILIALFLNINDTGSQFTAENTVTVADVEFNTPKKGYFIKPTQYRFDFNGFECAINHVEAFETDTPHRTIQAIESSKQYPGSEAYILHTNTGETWYGLKIKKDNEWYHISMMTENIENTQEYFNWMYEHNDWEEHN